MQRKRGKGSAHLQVRRQLKQRVVQEAPHLRAPFSVRQIALPRGFKNPQDPTVGRSIAQSNRIILFRIANFNPQVQLAASRQDPPTHVESSGHPQSPRPPSSRHIFWARHETVTRSPRSPTPNRLGRKASLQLSFSQSLSPKLSFPRKLADSYRTHF